MIKSWIGLLLAGASLMAAPAHAEWVEASSPHFLVLGEMPAEQARDWAGRLERIDKVLRTATNTADVQGGAIGKVTVFVVPSTSYIQKMIGNGSIGGFYNGNAQGYLAVTPRTITGGWEATPQRVLFHEYAHHILLSSTDTSYPDWVQEGFAEFFGTATFDRNGDMILGGLPVDRGYALGRVNQMRAEELFTASEGKLRSRGDGLELAHMYSRACAMVHMLMLKPERAGQLTRYLRLLDQGVKSVDAGRQAFGNFGKLDGELDTYVRSSRFQTLRVPAAKLTTGDVSVRGLRPCEAAIIRTRMRSAAGVNAKTAPAVAAQARKDAAGCENDPFVQRTLAETEFDAKNNAAAMAAADRALTLDPKNIMAMVYKGRVHARNKNWAEARKWFIKANREDPNYPLPLVLYYDSFVRAGAAPSAAAVNGLYRAIVLVPQDGSVRLRVARALISEGNLGRARTLLAPVAAGRDSKGDDAAAKVIALIDAKADTKAILAEADKAKWNEIGDE